MLNTDKKNSSKNSRYKFVSAWSNHFRWFQSFDWKSLSDRPGLIHLNIFFKYDINNMRNLFMMSHLRKEHFKLHFFHILNRPVTQNISTNLYLNSSETIQIKKIKNHGWKLLIIFKSIGFKTVFRYFKIDIVLHNIWLNKKTKLFACDRGNFTFVVFISLFIYVAA